MSSSNAHDGISDSDVDALETLWRAAAGAPSEAFLNQCIARSRAELAADRQQRASVRFYLMAAAVLLIGWHVSLVAAWSATTRVPRGEATSVAAHLDDRRTLLGELTAELAAESRSENSAPFVPSAAKTRH